MLSVIVFCEKIFLPKTTVVYFFNINHINFMNTSMSLLLFDHIHDLRRINLYLHISVAKPIATALVTSTLDYCHLFFLQYWS